MVPHVLVVHHPIQCTNVATDGPTNITLQRVDGFAGMELVYKCCLHNQFLLDDFMMMSYMNHYDFQGLYQTFWALQICIISVFIHDTWLKNFSTISVYEFSQVSYYCLKVMKQ